MLERVKRLLSIVDADRDDLLNDLLEDAKTRLTILIRESGIPDELEYIVINVAVARFNRIGSEGVAHHNVEGELSIYSKNDFEPFMEEIEAYLALKNPQEKRKAGWRFV